MIDYFLKLQFAFLFITHSIPENKLFVVGTRHNDSTVALSENIDLFQMS